MPPRFKSFACVAHINCKVGVEQDLEVIIDGAGVADHQACLQAVLVQGDGIDQAELIVPLRSGDHAVLQSEVELDGRVTFAGRQGG